MSTPIYVNAPLSMTSGIKPVFSDDWNYGQNNNQFLRGSDFDIDSTNDVEFISIPAWRMKDGNLIAIQDMDTSHIKNCIKMIYRHNGTWRHQYLRYFEAELRKRKYLKNPPIIVYVD